MSLIIYLGLLAGTLTTISFLPQVIKTFKTRKTDDISILMYIILCSGTFLWLAYGFFIKDIPLLVANSITFIFAFSILILKIKNN